MERSVQLLVVLFAFLACFAVGTGGMLTKSRLANDWEFIYVMVSIGALVAFLVIVALWSVIGPIISWARFFKLVLAILIAAGLGALGYFGFPPWQ